MCGSQCIADAEPLMEVGGAAESLRFAMFLAMFLVKLAEACDGSLPFRPI
jgi:hypothetical protein